MPAIEFASYIFTMVGMTLITLIVALKNFNSKINRSFVLFSIFVFLYVAAAFLSEIVLTLDDGLLWTRIALVVAVPIGALFYYFSVAYTNTKLKSKNTKYVLIALTVILMALGLSSYAITSIVPSKYGRTIEQTGPLMYVYLVYFVVIFAAGIKMLFSYAKKSSRQAVLQVRIISFGAGISVFLNLLTQIVLPQFGIIGYGDLIGIPSIIVLVGSIAYSIVRHHLFDIKTILLRSTAFFLTLASIYLTFSIIVFGISTNVFPDLKMTVLEQTYFIVATFVLSILFKPMYDFLSKLTNRIFYKDNYDPQELTNQISRILASEIELVTLSRRVRTLLERTMHINHINIVVLNENKMFVEGGHYVVSRLEGLAEDLSAVKDTVVVADDEPEGDRKEMLRSYGIRVLAVLKSRKEKIGYVLFGDKLSGSFYTPEDLKLISSVADQLAVAIDNSKSFFEIKKFNQTLKQRVSDATKQLKDVNTGLQEMDKVKDDFISMTSHQLGEPMTAIHGYLVAILKGLYGPLKDEQQKALEIATNRVLLTKGLVVDLLDISRMQVGKFQIITKPTDLNTIVAEEVDALKFKAKEKDVTIKFKPPKEPVPVISADEQKTRQVIMNMIDNAVYYAAKGHVEVTLEKSGDNVVFQVVDDGIGVPEDQQDKLFTKFYRAENAKEVRPDGTGIGLYLAKRVIEDQNGSIIFNSEKGEGSTFGFRLPLR